MVLFVSGSFPYAPDGISDGAKMLLEAMRTISGAKKILLYTTEREDIKKCLEDNNITDYKLVSDWKVSFTNINKFFSVLQDNPEISCIHMEYPGTYYGKTFMATLIPFIVKVYNIMKKRNIKTYVRLHEFTDARLLRKIAILPIAIWADKLYIPALKDRVAVSKLVGKKKVQRTLIGNNIPVWDNAEINNRNKTVISYFGAVYPGKGIDRMLDVWKELKNQDSSDRYQFKIIGDIGLEKNNKFYEYHCHVMKKIKDYNLKEYVQITGYLSEEEVSKEIQNTDIATVYFDDGLTLRRGSFLAFLAHGIPIVTSAGDHEANELFLGHEGIYMENEIKKCVNRIIQFSELSKEKLENIKDDNRKIAMNFSWNKIANSLLSDYGIID